MPPILFHSGEGFRLEKLPPGTSVVYPPEPLAALRDVDATIHDALLHPLDSEPLPALLRPGMQLTIAFDDISLPLPPMRRPDIRQRVIEAVLDLAAAAGVDDVHLIAALALHRRMTEDELRHAVGDRVYDAFAPRAPLQPRRRGPRQPVRSRHDRQGEEVEINKRAAESDLLVYVNINIVAMDGGHKSIGTGLASYRSIRHHHNVKTMEHCRSFMDRHQLRAAPLATGAWARSSATPASRSSRSRRRSTTTRSRRSSASWRSGVGVVGARPGDVLAMQAGLRLHAQQEPPADLQRAWQAPYGVTSCTPARSIRSTSNVQRASPAPRRGRGPDRHPHHGAAVHLPLQRRLDHEPDPRDVPRPRLLLQPVPRAAAGARGRRADHDPPHAVGVPPRPPPELHRLLRAGARRHDRPARDRAAKSRSSSPRTSGTATSTARATPTTASTRSTCGTGARTR